MFELFPDQPVYEYPQLINITYSFIWAFLLASIIAITHKLTFTGDYYPKNFFQSLILGAVVTTMVMMAIGDSLARGLGVFGAMAIIRFRTRIDDPRDVLFLFAALSTGLAIGVYGFTISFVGSVLFCSVAALLHVSPFRSFAHHSYLFFTLSDAKDLEGAVTIIQHHCRESRVVSITVNKENAIRYQYAIVMKNIYTKDQLINQLRLLEGVKQLKITSNELISS
ncbi:MAG: DUF4956 domain-containing protein [Cyclobacteriaceae bacterium]|nr:DUF4956 domain-containing protein [Cyclobacteriaceae bacterium]